MRIGQPDIQVDTTGLNAPPRPPARERDTLDGLLEATLFPAAKPHRDRLIDILRVIGDTQIGREVLHDFRTLAMRGQFPTVDILEPGDASLTQHAKRPHCLLIARDALTANAREIGVPPEVEQASPTLFRLVEIRNVLAAAGKSAHFHNPVSDAIDVPMDPLLVGARFRDEMRARQGVQSRSGIAGANADECPTVPMRPGRGAPPPDTYFDKAPATLQVLAAPNKLSTVSNPYRPVTETTDSVEQTAPMGNTRRVFQWAEQQVRSFRDFVLRRREPSADSADSRTPVLPVSGSGDEKPILRDARPSRHRRTQSIRHRREVEPGHGGPSADTNPTRKAKEAP